MKNTPAPMLDVLRQGFAARGWDPTQLGGFRMELDLETSIADLRKDITAAEQRSEAKRAAADKLVEDAQKRGANPLTDEGLFTEVDAAYKEADLERDVVGGLRSRLTRALEIAGQRNDRAGTRPPEAPRPGGGGRNRLREMARRFTESDEYSRLRASGVLSMSRAHVEMPPVEVLSRAELRAVFDKSAGGAMVAPDLQLFPPLEIPVRKPTLLDLITVGETDSDLVRYVVEVLRADAADAVAFGTALPEAAYDFEPRDVAVKRVGQWIPAMKDTLADQAQTQTLLEGRLTTGVRLRLETLGLVGDGVGERFLGILNTPGIGVVATRDVAHADEYDLDAIHRGITAVRLALFEEPTAIGFNPTTFEAINLQKDDQGRYIYPPGQEVETLWGIRPTVSALYPARTALVGDFRRGASLWLRSALSVAASDSHDDFFIRGMVAIAAEMRAAFTVPEPRAFAKVTGLGNP